MEAKVILTSFCIYGAGIVATSIYKAMQTIYGRVPVFFLVSDTVTRQGIDENPQEIDGIPVKTLSSWRGELRKLTETIQISRTDVSVTLEHPPERDPAAALEVPAYYLAAVPERHHPAVVEALHDLGIEDDRIFLFTNQRENELMERYYSSLQNCDTVKRIVSAAKRTDADKTDTHNPEGKSICVYQAKSHM